MPRGDGTGPFANGPMNRGAGRGLGRRRNMNASGNCPRGSGLGSGPQFNRPPVRGVGMLQGPILKLLGMAVMAIPALLKARKQIEAPDAKVLTASDKNDGQIIEIEAVPVEEKEKE